MESKDFTEKLLRQLEEVEKAGPSDDFLKRMEAVAVQAVATEAKVVQFNARSMLSIAASLLFLVMLNSYAILSANNESFASRDADMENYDLLAIQNFYDE